MWEWSPTSSRLGCESACSTAARAAPDSIEKPNLESSWPVAMKSWVSGRTPGDTRTWQRMRRPGGTTRRSSSNSWNPSITRVAPAFQAAATSPRLLLLEPQPHAPPQQPPPAPAIGRVEVNSPSPPTAAKLDTITRVLLDSQDGQTCGRSRSANEVSTSKLRSQASQRYS